MLPVLFCLHTAACAAGSQGVIRSWLPWRTIETPHFAFHYPTALEEWTVSVAERIESIDSAVSRVVGYRPPTRTDVVVDDPYSIANGSAWSYLERPVINLWAVPPSPREDVGQYRVWGEMLAAHEFAHIAHLTRPSRNPATRMLWRLLPVDLGPVALRAPRWVLEGYATYVEGRVTGSGRPYGAWRPAFLRQWALEGQLPAYDQLNNSGAFAGGEFAYLAGSAYIEWLVARQGDSSVVHLWRRLSARTDRSFDDAFTGVFGESARTLYGRFTVELTAKSLDAARLLASAGADSGRVVQRLTWDTGDPAISPDGARIAVTVRSPLRPARLVVWQTAPEPDTAKAKRDSALRARDPEDVPARAIYPPPKHVIATLKSVGGLSYQGPRFLRDGRILVWRNSALGDGSYAPDLYLWDPARNTVRRVTHGEAVSYGDPLPDGRSALANRCRAGRCDVVQVDLESGAVTEWLRGSPRESYYRPRVSPDGKTFVVALQRDNRWRLVTFDSTRAVLQNIDPGDPSNHYDAAWISPREIVAVSEASGTPNLVLIDVERFTARPLTNVTGAAVAPEINLADRSVWFLGLYSKGYDLRRVVLDSTPSGPRVALSPALSPAAPAVSRDTVTFASGPVSEPRRFGLEPRLFRWIPLPEVGADGAAFGVALTSIDVIGRSELITQLVAGQRAAWRGASFAFAWHGRGPPVDVRLFSASQQPSGGPTRVAPRTPLDLRFRGAEVAAGWDRSFEVVQFAARGGVSRAQLSEIPYAVPNDTLGNGGRSIVFGEGGVSWQQRGDALSTSESIHASLSAGRARGATYERVLVSAAARASAGGMGASLTVVGGRVNAGADAFERFAIGGMPTPLIDESILPQRISMPVLPTAIDVADAFVAARAAVSVAGFTPYYWVARNRRVIGLDWSIGVPRIPMAGTPAARAQFGIGESLDAPLRHGVRGYASLVLRP